MLSALVFAQLLALAPPEASSSASEGPTIGALPVRIDADLAAPDRTEIAERFSGGLQRSGFAVQPVRAEGADTCQQAECYRELAEAAAVPNLASAEIGRQGPDYTVRAYVVSGQSGEVLAEVEGVCEICGVQELGDMVEGLAVRLRPQVDTAIAPTRLKVESDPPGATVLIDGREAGTTPLEVDVTPGSHEVEVSRAGYRTERTEAELRPGTTGAYSYRLARATKIPSWLPWTAIGVGVGSAAAGVALIAIHDRPVRGDCNADIAGTCEFLHDTIAGGIALTITGVALIGTGVALAIVRKRQGSSRRINASAWLTSPGITISGRF